MNGLEFRCRREALGYSQSFLATMLEIAQASISRWETDKQVIPFGIEEKLFALGTEAAEHTLMYIEYSTDSDVLLVDPKSALDRAAAGRALLADRHVRIESKSSSDEE